MAQFAYTLAEVFHWMNSITALLHTQNDALRLGRCLETLYPCDEILVVDHGSQDGTISVAREYGAHVVRAAEAGVPGHSLWSAFGPVTAPWLLCLDPRESLTESLAASLYEWKTEPAQNDAGGYSIFLREETADGWVAVPAAQTRLVRADWKRWHGSLPAGDDSAVALEGDLLRFVFP